MKRVVKIAICLYVVCFAAITYELYKFGLANNSKNNWMNHSAFDKDLILV